MTMTPADFLREPEPTPEPKKHVPTLHFSVPPLTTKQIVDAVQNNKPVWRTLQALHEESIEERRAAALERKYGRTPIPEPDGFWDAEDL